MYTVGMQYTRRDLYELLDISKAEQGGDWLNGYHRHRNDYYVFCNVGMPGRTGHDYPNRWDGEKLIWHGKNRSNFEQQAIRNLVSGDYRVFVFYRDEDRAPFTFAGIGHAVPHRDSEFPVRIDWVFSSDEIAGAPVFTDEYAVGAQHTEGQRVQVLVNRYERDRNAREKCIRHHGVICCVCGFDFGERFGELGRGFIHVHHIVPVSEIGESYEVDPIKHLIPLCPNCHAMIHRRNPPLSVDELKGLM